MAKKKRPKREPKRSVARKEEQDSTSQKKSVSKEVSADENSESDSPTNRSGRRKMLSRLLLILVVVVVAAGSTFLIDYFRRAPIREARQKIEEADYSFAVATLKQFLEDYPNDNTAKSLLARAHAGLNEFDACVKIYQQIEGAFEFEDMFAFAKSLTVLSRYSEAYSNWIGVMAGINEGALDSLDDSKKKEKQIEALYFMAVCQAQIGRIDRAISTTDDLLRIDPDQIQGHYLRGLIEGKRGERTEALKSWERVAEIDPTVKDLKIPSHIFYFEYGEMAVLNEQSKQGIAMLTQSLKQNGFVDLPRAAIAMELIGKAHLDLGDNDQAKHFWTRLLDFEKEFRQPPSTVAHEGLANLALTNQEPKKAIELLVPLKLSGQGDRSSTTYIMQRAHAMLGNEDQAAEFGELTRKLREQETKISTIRDAVANKQDSHWSVVIRAYDFANSGNWQQAEYLLGTVDEFLTDEFSIKLKAAVAKQGSLPPLTDIDIDIF